MTEMDETRHEEILEFIARVKEYERERGYVPENVYQGGDCGNMFVALKIKFPELKAYFSHGHIFAGSDEGSNSKFFDIHGDVTHHYPYVAGLRYRVGYDEIKRCSNNYNRFHLRKNTKRKPLLRKGCPMKTRLAIMRDTLKDQCKPDKPIKFKHVPAKKFLSGSKFKPQKINIDDIIFS
jgi:hypothetical protein